MSGKPSSRWANTKEDAELEAKIKKEKEEKKRRKAEKARKLQEEEEEEQEAAAALEASRQQQQDESTNDQELEHRPSKRRRLSPGRDTPTAAGNNDTEEPSTRKLLRFETRGWGRSRSVENYDKLNDIEEGTYGWVARATEIATGKVVALKRLKLEPGDRNGLPVTGLREMQILRECRHRNIVAMEEVVVGDHPTKPDKYVSNLIQANLLQLLSTYTD